MESTVIVDTLWMQQPPKLGRTCVDEKIDGEGQFVKIWNGKRNFMDEGFFPSNFPVGQSPKEAEKKKLNQLAPSSSLGTSYNK
jgi:hypothetical protein